MPDFAKALKEEIQRLARKEVKQETALLKKENIALKRRIAELNKRLERVEKRSRKVIKAVSPHIEEAEASPAGEVDSARVSAKMMRNLRDKWDITQGDMALLLGVSPQSVYQWERKEGRLNLRREPKAAVVAIRDLGKRDVMKRLADLKGTDAKNAAGTRRPRRKKA